MIRSDNEMCFKLFKCWKRNTDSVKLDEEFLDNIGKIQIQVMGEQENCSYEEKVWVQVVQWSRIFDKKYKFNPIEKDFRGYNRKIDINSDITREQLKESIRQTIDQWLRLKRCEIEPIHFFMLNGEPSTVFRYKEVETPDGFKHKFFRLY